MTGGMDRRKPGRERTGCGSSWTLITFTWSAPADGTVRCKTGPLLFAGITSDQAFFLTIGDHDSFDDGSITKMMHDKLDAEAAASGGGVYMPPGGGVASDGTKVVDTLRAIGIVKTLDPSTRIWTSRMLLATRYGLTGMTSLSWTHRETSATGSKATCEIIGSVVVCLERPVEVSYDAVIVVEGQIN